MANVGSADGRLAAAAGSTNASASIPSADGAAAAVPTMLWAWISEGRSADAVCLDDDDNDDGAEGARDAGQQEEEDEEDEDGDGGELEPGLVERLVALLLANKPAEATT